MDQVFSSRMDSSVVQLVDDLSDSMETSKKQVLENAVRQYWASSKGKSEDVFRKTSGVWANRGNSTEEIVKGIKGQFESDMRRYQ